MKTPSIEDIPSIEAFRGEGKHGLFETGWME